MPQPPLADSVTTSRAGSTSAAIISASAATSGPTLSALVSTTRDSAPASSAMVMVRWMRPPRTGRSSPHTTSTRSTLAAMACSFSPVPAARRRRSESRGRVATGVWLRSRTTQSPTTGGGVTGRPNMARTGPVSSATMRPAPSWRMTRPGAGWSTSAASGVARYSAKRDDHGRPSRTGRGVRSTWILGNRASVRRRQSTGQAALAVRQARGGRVERDTVMASSSSGARGPGPQQPTAPSDPAERVCGADRDQSWPLRRCVPSVLAVQVIHGVGPCPTPLQPSAVTIGAYDGVHLGHRAVIDEVRGAGRRAGAARPWWSPSTGTRPWSCGPESAPRLLCDLDQKLELLAEAGVDATYVVALRRGAGQGDGRGVRPRGAGRLPDGPGGRRRRGLPLRAQARRQRRAAPRDGRRPWASRSRAWRSSAPTARRPTSRAACRPPRSARC